MLQADYLVVGSGAMGMAFTDVLMTETDATVVMIDRHHQPGGHWNIAYPYVRLHQPSAFYGVNSRPLGTDTIDQTGWNKGLYELATNSEVCAYFDLVMQQQFLPSGRVQYFPMCDHLGERRFRSLVSGETWEVSPTAKIVNATYMNVTVPAMRPPKFEVADGVTCIPPNGLPKIQEVYDRHVIIGAGKTGMDACLWLLKNGVDADAISWIMPRDSWLLDRARIQPGALFSDRLVSDFAAQLEASAAATSLEDLFERLERESLLLRLDSTITPTMYRCATVTVAELEQLRRIEHIIRKGRVERIEPGRLTLTQGTVDMSGRVLHVDCSADGLEKRPPVPVFDGDRITLQSVRTCQQVFSAAFIAHVAASYPDDALRNELCTPVPHPDTHLDWLRTTLSNGMNQARWGQDPELLAWLAEARLDGFRGLATLATSTDPKHLKLRETIQANAMPAVAKLTQLLEQAEAG